MAQQTIDIGSAPNDGTGDPIRDAFDKCNDNFVELYAGLTGLLDFKGSTDCSANPNYPAASKGDFYLVSVAGKIGGASGIVVEVGDSYFAIADNAGGTQAGVGTSWTVIQGNITSYLPLSGGTLTGDLIVPDEAYDATNWNASLEVPTKNAVRDKIEDILDGVTFSGDIIVPDEAYDATNWNGSLEVPTKNAVRDKIESMSSGSVSDAAYDASWDGDTTTAPSKNAVYDKIETLGGASVSAWKSPVRAATVAAGTLASSFENGDTIDGVTLATNDRILIKNQATATENGIYTVNASGAPTRATDADAGSEMLGAAVFVSEGTVNADSVWGCTNNATISLGSTNLAFAKIGGSWKLVGSWTFSSNVPTVDFTGLDGYNEILVVMRGITTSSSAFRAVWVSVDGGGTFYTSSGDYITVDAAGVEANTTSAGSHGTSTTLARTTVVQITNAASTVTMKRCYSNGFLDRLFVASASPINAIRAGATAGNMTAGTIQVFAR